MAPEPNRERARTKSDLPVYRISQAMESFNRKAERLRNALGCDGGFQFVQRAWARKDEDSGDKRQFKTLSELPQEPPDEFWKRCESSTGYFLFTYFRNESSPQSSPLGDTSSLLCKWIRESLRQGGIWHTFLDLIEWPNDIARNARDEVKRRARNEKEIYHDLLQLFVRLPIRGYIPELVHRAWWRHRWSKRKGKSKPNGASGRIPDVSFLTRTVSGEHYQTPLPGLTVRRILPDGMESAANLGEEVLPGRHRDIWAKDKILPQPGPDPRILFGENEENDQRKARQVQLLYSTVLDPLYREELDEEELEELRSLFERAIRAGNTGQILEEQAEEELEEIHYLWIPLLAKYGLCGGHGSLLGWLFTELSPKEMSPQELYSEDQGPSLQLLLERLSGQIRRVARLEAERQAMSQNEGAHQALENRVHYLGDFKIRNSAGTDDADLTLSQSELDARLTPTTSSRPPDRTYTVHYGPDVLPPPTNIAYREDLNASFRNLYRSLRRIKRAEESGKMRFQRVMSSTYSHSYMKTAKTIKDNIKTLPDKKAVATEKEIKNHIGIRESDDILQSSEAREAMQKLHKYVSEAYKIVGKTRDFYDIKLSYIHLYKRLGHLDNLLTSNISDLRIYPDKDNKEDLRKEIEGVISDIRGIEANLGYGEISDGIRYLRNENIDLGCGEDIYRRDPAFGPDRKVKKGNELVDIFGQILKEGVWRELIVNALDAFADGEPDPSEAWIKFRREGDTLLFENWADNSDRVSNGREQVKIREPHGGQGFGLYGARMTATDILQIANTVEYFERPTQSCVEISMRQGWIVNEPA